MAVDVSMFARLRSQRYIEKPDISATHGDDPGTYLHPGQGLDAPYITSEISSASASWINMDSTTNGTNNGDGSMSFPVTVNVDYGFRFTGTYSSANAGTGIAIGFALQDGATGNERGMSWIYGETSPTSEQRDWQDSDDNGGTGTSGVDSVDTARLWILEGRFQCTASGTFMLRFKRQGANHAITIQAGSCGVVSGF